MRCLVTGAAGFIGSHLCERLLAEGHQVIGLDAFIPYYPRQLKEHNLQTLHEHPHFVFCEADLRFTDLQPLLRKVEAVFHLAAMPGLMASWSDFELYMNCNLHATQRLLEAVRSAPVERIIVASTSSVYGREACGDEKMLPHPVSPYGVTKLAAEHLCMAYQANFGLPITILRYFSIYGPRQRPDMAYNIFIDAIVNERPIILYGDGEQTRSNTFISDCVEGSLLALKHDVTGEIINIGGGEIVSMNRVIAQIEALTGRTALVEYDTARPGDQRHTAAEIGKARRLLGYAPQVGIEAGLKAQLTWQLSLGDSREPAISMLVPQGG